MNNEFEVGDLVRCNFAVGLGIHRDVGVCVVTEVYRSSRRVKWVRVIAHWGKEFVRKPEWVELVAKGNPK